ncbi:MAG TPA: ATP-binding protein [Thiobacillaceae bacterium]|nr:ATP-binding protein [Thiobacillaceae bacterium]HNU64711.1 ATP-binding protein [Thiobacillaceae bacterium]
MRSIRAHLSVHVLAALLLALVPGGYIAYQSVLRESDIILDYHLRQVARTQAHRPAMAALPETDAASAARFDLVIQIWDATGSRLYLSRPHTDLPGFAQLGYTTLNTAEGRWRVYSEQIRGRVVQVAQPMAVREGLALEMALRVMLPWLGMVPLLVALVWFAIGRGLAVLGAVTQAVDARNPDSLEPLRLAWVPDELRPLVAALDALLARLAQALEAQRTFTADAAHELRTPLAALQLQTQMLARSRNEEERQQALGRLQGGLQRATHVVEQLLTLARQEDGAPAPRENVDLHALAVGVIAERAPLARARGIDLGLASGETTASIPGDARALHILLANLVDNALRFTPPGGQVDVDVGRGREGAWLAVRDTGPGIRTADRERVFDRFFRGTAATDQAGSGLGLAIVQRIAQRHGARLVLEDAMPGPGLRVSVVFTGHEGVAA